MKRFFPLLALLLISLPLQTSAQGSGGISSGDLGSGRFADFEPVDLFTVNADQMTYVASEDELVAIFIKQGENGLSAARGYALYANQREADCSDSRVHCIVIHHEEQWLVFPFGFASAGGLGSTRVVNYNPTREVRVDEAQLASIPVDRELNQLVEVSDGNRLTARNGATLISTNGDDADCS